MGIFTLGEKLMNLTLEGSKTLLVEGPASVTVLSGKVSVLGSPIKHANGFVIRKGKRLPFTIERTADLNILLGYNASIEKIDGNTIPPSWSDAFEKLSSFHRKPAIAIVLGGIDTGKTSFCTYLLNKLLESGQKVAVLDGDLGQSDIGPPCTLAYANVFQPTPELYTLRAKNMFFVGVTSPIEALDRTIEGLVHLKSEILEGPVDFVLVNTDGWVEGEEAISYKTRFVEELKPDLIFCIQLRNELGLLLGALENFPKISAESPTNVMLRDREKRKNLRDMSYAKYLANSKAKTWFLDQFNIEEDILGLNQRGWSPIAKRAVDALETKPLHAAELSDAIMIVLDKNGSVNQKAVESAAYITKKKVRLIRKGEESGILLGLCDQKKRFLGIGVLYEVDYLKRKVRVLTPVREKPSSIVFGKVWLDENLREIPAPWNKTP
jgi:polynucleotide 5'-hydroxyl-kinase GRC3/NOL9